MKQICIVSLLICISISASGLDLAEIYGKAEEFSDIFNDPNTGLTVFPTLTVPTGGKYEGMGTAYSAVALDSGYLEANPSASSVLDYTELSFLHNNWISDTNVEGVVYTMRLDDLGIGFGGKFLYVPFSSYDDFGERIGEGYYSETVATANVSYNFFSSYYFYGLALGANVKIAYRSVPATSLLDQSALAGLIDVGALTRLNFLKFYSSRSKNFSVGVVLKNLGPLVKNEPLPTVVTIGLAYSPLQPIIIAYDLNIPIGYGQGTEQINMAGGLDISVTDFFSIQSGFNYRGSNPRFTLGGSVNLEKVSFVANYTLDLSTQFEAFDRFSIEAKINLGDEGRLALRNKTDEYYLAGVEEFADGNLTKAIAAFEKALELDPDFVPALDYLEEAKRQLANRDRLKSNQ